ncbi:hypothetical protein HBI24_209310 [Parastagonospora nodorum]|nr:hypothetical protein HBH71_212680 [Parastagonospora nodorum]KAH5572551.1 hypothetical protein HBI24_209310 [Parastagonospora nodorum]
MRVRFEVKHPTGKGGRTRPQKRYRQIVVQSYFLATAPDVSSTLAKFHGPNGCVCRIVAPWVQHPLIKSNHTADAYGRGSARPTPVQRCRRHFIPQNCAADNTPFETGIW